MTMYDGVDYTGTIWGMKGDTATYQLFLCFCAPIRGILLRRTCLHDAAKCLSVLGRYMQKSYGALQKIGVFGVQADLRIPDFSDTPKSMGFRWFAPVLSKVLRRTVPVL